MKRRTKEQTTAYNKAYYAKNRQRILEQAAEYRASQDPEAVKRYQKEYNQNNKDQINKRNNSIDGMVTSIWAGLRERARKKGYESDIDKDHIRILVEEAKERFGDMIVFEVNSPCRPSIDQIEPGKGYLRGNVQIIPAWLNFAYQDYGKFEVDQQILRYAEYLRFEGMARL